MTQTVTKSLTEFPEERRSALGGDRARGSKRPKAQGHLALCFEF